MTVLTSPTTAAAAANEFLQLGWSDMGVPPITQMKLQKLLFYAHAWHLATRENPLFDEDFEAWAWGPVLRDVYFQTREFGKAPITKHISRLTVAPGEKHFLNARFETPVLGEADQDVKAFIRSVWESHKPFSGVQLSNSTHAPGEPWTIIKDKYRTLDGKPTIPNDLIAEVFKKKIADAAASRAAAGNPAA
jgi:uncharacterized phage-associated protein